MIGGLQGEEWKFIQKYLKEKISCGVGRNRGKFARWSSNFALWFQVCEIPTLWTEEFRTLISIVRNYPSAWCSCLPKAISSSFQLQIVHGLKCWIRALKRYIECKKWTSGSAPKVPKKTAAAVLYFPPCFSLLLFGFLCFSPLDGLS